MDWSNEVILEFLHLYESEPVIWNPKEPLHKNRNAVTEAWQRIERSLSVKCSVPELKKKKESLMATFRPLLNKVRASIKAGRGAQQVYKPSWFAFETMAKFLHGVYRPRIAINIQEMEVVRGGGSEERNVLVEAENSRAERHTGSNLCAVPYREMSRGAHSSQKVLAETGNTRKRRGTTLGTVRGSMEETHQNLGNVCDNREKDECLLYAELLAKKLRTLDENTREIVTHEINDLMFRAKTQNQNLRSLPSSYSCPGGLHSTAANSETCNCRPCSLSPNHFRMSMTVPSPEPPSEAKSPRFTADLS